ncbi:MAG: cytochrome C [Gammaproteobacteria bacterium]|nr:cytochrome C [Gammaproteobacteria bacterium]
MNIIKSSLLGLSVCAALSGSLLSDSVLADATVSSAESIDRGEYLARIAGCNDCHTAGYPEAAGNIPKNQWLVGTDVGFKGPWGTSYPANLRLYFANNDEEQWLARARSPMLPPMPWIALRDMSDEDLLAIYRFVRSLGPAGEPVPVASGPDQPVNTPYIEFFPKNLPVQAASH